MGNNHKNAMIAMLLGALVVMAVAYAAFSTALTINGTATINSSWNVHFDTTKTSGTGVINPTTGAGGSTAPSGTVSYTDGQHASVSATLRQPGDKVVFTLTIKNEGSLKATLGAPSATAGEATNCSGLICTSSAGHIKFTVGSPLSSTLNATNGSTTMQVTAEFVDTAVTSLSSGEGASIVVSITATQAAS